MSFTDPIGDLLTRMRNAQHGRRTECAAPWSKIKESLCLLLKTEGFLQDVRTEDDGGHRKLVVVFRQERSPLSLKRVSSPGSRTYVGAGDIRDFLHGNSAAILSTSLGLLTGKQAKAKKVGGELLCTIS